MGESKMLSYFMDQFPIGILSVVSDTFDLWQLITKFLPENKEQIMSRDGKLVIRPDSGDPVDILCGFPKNEEGLLYNSEENIKNGASYYLAPMNTPEEKGVIELLWDVFGGTINEQGYKVLDPHIGAIYGDSITIDRANEICERLEAKGFASTNVVLGIGSFTYQYNTRDTFGFAMKATYVEVEGEGREIFKDPITDDGTKKSATGLLSVASNSEGLYLVDKCSWPGENVGLLQTIYKDGEFFNLTTLTEIRNLLKTYN
jgi:nicotinamide phosphoribosyltransferase